MQTLESSRPVVRVDRCQHRARRLHSAVGVVVQRFDRTEHSQHAVAHVEGKEHRQTICAQPGDDQFSGARLVEQRRFEFALQLVDGGGGGHGHSVAGLGRRCTGRQCPADRPLTRLPTQRSMKPGALPAPRRDHPWLSPLTACLLC